MLLLIVVVIGLTSGTRVRPLVAQGGSLPAREPIENITNDVDLFDQSVVHKIEVTIDDDDRKRMLDTYRTDEEKLVVPVDLTIDGVAVPGAGIRFKGNSSLWGVEDPSGLDGEFEEDPDFDAAFDDCLAERGVDFDEAFIPADGDTEIDAEIDGEGFGVGLHDGSGDDFAAPYLLVLNHENPARRYQGHSSLALRTDGGSAILAEPVTVAAYDAAGLPAPESAIAGVRLNGGDERLYGISTVLDQRYVDENLGGADGALYKATARQSQSFEYLGEDATRYSAFAQVTGRKRHDKAPLIGLMRFVAEADDETFARELPRRVDIEMLARLLAVNNMLVNTDSLGTGPGGNYYLFHDADRGLFVPLGWDFNFSLGGLDGFMSDVPTDPLDGRGGLDAEGLGGDDDAFFYCDQKVIRSLDDAEPDGAEAEGPADEDFDEHIFGAAHPLVERFMAVERFRDLYAERYRELYGAVYGSGRVAASLESLKATVETALDERPSLAPVDRFDDQNRALQTFVEERGAFLRGNLP